MADYSINPIEIVEFIEHQAYCKCIATSAVIGSLELRHLGRCRNLQLPLMCTLLQIRDEIYPEARAGLAANPAPG